MFVPHTDMGAMTLDYTPVVVAYCSVCGIPPDFCKYGPNWDKHPNSTEPRTEPKVDSHVIHAPVVTKATTGSIVTVKIAPRVGRRFLTTISGLEDFDVDLSKACKVFAKKFACGVGKKDDTGEVEIQGDVEEAIVATITSNWKNIRTKQIVIKRKEK